MNFFDFDIIRQPELPEHDLRPHEDKQLLVIHRAEGGRREFLFAILKAAGYTNPGEYVHLLPLPEDDADTFDLAGLIRQLSVVQVMIFGIAPAQLGLRFQLGNYVPVEVNECWYLLADDLAVIREEKEAGKPQKAGALWKAIKARFAKTA